MGDKAVIYNSRNYKGVLIVKALNADGNIYNSRNYKGVLIHAGNSHLSAIYNSRNYKGVLIADGQAGGYAIYNSRNYKGVLIRTPDLPPGAIYNSRNYKGVLIPNPGVTAIFNSAISTIAVNCHKPERAFSVNTPLQLYYTTFRPRFASVFYSTMSNSASSFFA